MPTRRTACGFFVSQHSSSSSSSSSSDTSVTVKHSVQCSWNTITVDLKQFLKKTMIHTRNRFATGDLLMKWQGIIIICKFIAS
jgi:hypothetical protein